MPAREGPRSSFVTEINQRKHQQPGRALALLLGIPAKKIPWPLQHWTTHAPYTGNSILRRIDPQDSMLDNPWRHLQLRLVISLSKRAYNNLRKQHGLPPRKVDA